VGKWTYEAPFDAGEGWVGRGEGGELTWVLNGGAKATKRSKSSSPDLELRWQFSESFE